MSGSRLPSGGRIDRSRPIPFTFDGRDYSGFHGDTLASALLANGVDVVARGIATGRPRGIFSAGVEEPALVQVHGEVLRATQLELAPGLEARGLRGRGRLEPERSATRFDKGYAHCDVLVVGGGAAGLAAALAAGQSGARVLLADEGFELGGASANAWLAATVAQLQALPELRVFERATAIAYHDHQYVLVAQRRPTPQTEGRLWHVRARQVVLATGAHERSIAFADNDRPGVMLAGAARTYVERYGVRPGARAVVFTTNDSGLAAARDLARAGVEIADVVDAREGRAVAGTLGDERLEGAIVDGTTVACDLLAVSGGWNPVVQLFSQSRGRLRYDARLAAYVPDQPFQATHVAGAANGTFAVADSIREGLACGARAACEAGFVVDPPPAPVVEAHDLETRPSQALWVVPSPTGSWDTHFVDLERDVTVADLRRAIGTGMRSIEHVKRFTSAGTASDQGKTSGATTSAIAAALLGAPDGSTGMPTFRAPYSPVSFAVLAGRERGALHDAVRTTSIHPWHVAHGAVFEDVGQWKRPRYFPRPNESLDEAVLRECAAARTGVGVIDASTLGKIDLQGPDAGQFLDRIYTNSFSKLAVGSCRYGVMCKLDGMVFDDGTTSRLANDRFLMTTTTGNAAPVLDWIEEWLQTEWPELRVRATSVTEQWATVAVVGPRSRDVLRALAPSLNVDKDAFPFMTWRATEVGGVPARVFRISFSGELAYEVNVAWWHGLALWKALMAAGARFGITPYGTETMHVLRAEKGYPMIGQETDGTVTPQDLGMDWVVSKKKPFLGSRSHRRPDTTRADRKQLVSLLTVDPEERLPEGAQLVDNPKQPLPMRMVGHVTSSYRSAALGRTFALALVKNGRSRIGETLHAPLADRTIAASIAAPVLYDPENQRRDG
jgi:sarcosine oxidase subunit alpha